MTVFFGLVAAAAIQWIVMLGLAELSSAFPSSGVSSDVHSFRPPYLTTKKKKKGTVSLHIYGRTCSLQEICSIYSGHFQRDYMVGDHSLGDVHDGSFSLWDCHFLASRVYWRTVACVLVLCVYCLSDS